MAGWIREHAPSLRQGGAQATARLVTEVPTGGPLLSGGDAALDPDSPIAIVWDAVTTPVEPEVAEVPDEISSRAGYTTAMTAAASLTCANGMTVIQEMTVLAPHLRPAAVPTVTRQLVALALEWGPAHMRRFRPLLAEIGRDGELDDLQGRAG